VNLYDTPEEAAFRVELRSWPEKHLPRERRGTSGGQQRHHEELGRTWSRKLYEAGYAGLTWPKQYGGGSRR
jgi:alkylation response protein AidB-like acyl-CoA dehydrogenase